MTVLETITSQFLDERGWSRKTPLALEQVRQWLQSDDLEVLSAAFQLLQNKNAFARVEPPLTPQGKRVFLTRYFEKALSESKNQAESREDSQGIDDGFNLSHALAYWVADFLRDQATPEPEREKVLVWLRDLVLHHPDASLITTAVLDHLVWNRATKRYFKSWHTDADLAFLFAS